MNQTSMLADSIISADNGAVVRQLAQQFGISEDQAAGAVRSLAPALARGLGRETEQPDGMESLRQALEGGRHRQYLDDPAILAQPATTEDGNKILGHVFGSKDVSRNVAQYAAQQTGLDTSLLKKLLPVLAPIVMAILAKQLSGGGRSQPSPEAAPSAQRRGGGGLMDVLGGFLDTNRNGSMMDDLISMAGKAMQGRR